MCGRFTLTSDFTMIYKRFNILKKIKLDYKPSYNIAPTQNVLVITKDEKEGNELRLMRWGLIPFWAKDMSIGSKMINARAETLTEKPSFKHLLYKSRCLILADSFYEWQSIGTKKKAYRILLKDALPFAMAGLYDKWVSPLGEEIYSCTIITTKSNSLIKQIHDRMPVILNAKNEVLWLNLHSTLNLNSLLSSYAPEDMEYYEVSNYVNSPKHDTIECIKPIKNK
ncbi:MAG: SOS response-associated peptidase [Bacillota bacterium]